MNSQIIKTLSPEEAWIEFEKQVHKRMGISAVEFCDRMDAGEFNDPYHEDHCTVIYLMMTRPIR